MPCWVLCVLLLCCASLSCFPVCWPWQEHKQRSELLEGLRAEAARLRQLHDTEVKGLQAELEGRLSALQQRHREKVSSRLCLWPLGSRGMAWRDPHLVPLPPCTAQGDRHKGRSRFPGCAFLVGEKLVPFSLTQLPVQERKLQDSEKELEIRVKSIQARSEHLLSQVSGPVGLTERP